MNKNIFNIIVPLTYHGYRVDKFLHLQIKEFSRTRIQNLISDGQVKINNITIYNSSKKIKETDQIIVNIPAPKETFIKANKIPLDILYDDEDIVVVNKFPGVVVHPGAGNYENTIVNGLLYKYKNKLSSVGGKLRPGIVHRIDKDTSGVIVIAKNNYCHSKLSSQFEKHTIKRKYEALIWGVLRPLNGKIENKIGRSNYNRQKMAVRINKGKKAITNYKTIKVFQNKNVPTISLVELILETGRTHQIRVQMANKGNPVLGDKIYGGQKLKFKNIDLELEKKIKSFDRQALHAKYLEFFHPSNGNIVKYQANQPEDFKNLIDILKKLSKT